MKLSRFRYGIRSVVWTTLFLTAMTSVHAQGGPPGRGPGQPDMQTIHSLLAANTKIKRTVKNLPNGIEAVTESSDPNVAKKIQEHVAGMKWRLEKQQPIRRGDPLFAAIFENAEKFTLVITNTKNGVKISETSDDAYAVKLLQAHAKAVSHFC